MHFWDVLIAITVTGADQAPLRPDFCTLVPFDRDYHESWILFRTDSHGRTVAYHAYP